VHHISEFQKIRTSITGFTQLGKSFAVLKKPNSDHKSGSGSNFENRKKTLLEALIKNLHAKNLVNRFIAASFTASNGKKTRKISAESADLGPLPA
jgi:hypothetical protein